jgi:Tfp pilus assembly protein PilX
MARAGFGLLSVLLSLLVIGLLSAVALTHYLSATHDPRSPAEGIQADQSARLAEAQALLGRAMTALTLCAQTTGTAGGLAGRASGGCSLAEIAANAGVGPNGVTADGRWQITVAEISMSGRAGVPTGQVSIAGIGGTAAGLSASLFATPSGMVSRCEVGGARPPSSPSSGQGC